MTLEELGLKADDGVFYKPSGWLTLRRILRARDVSSDDVFVDFGSGMGRILLLAVQYPFRRVVGVELSEELNEIAKANVAANRRRQRCGIVHAFSPCFGLPDSR